MNNERTYARVELYNLISRGRAVGNGWLVARVTAGGRRMNTLKKFERDESAARAYAELWNGPEADRQINRGSYREAAQ
jgi:hypothetical protein